MSSIQYPKEKIDKLLLDYTERLKELQGINKTIAVLGQVKSLDVWLQGICNELPDAWQFPDDTVIIIVYDGRAFMSEGFRESPWSIRKEFTASGGKNGYIEVYYTREHPISDEGPFLKEERNLLNNLAEIISGSAAKSVLEKLSYDNRERLKELRAINQTTNIISRGLPFDETLKKIVSILPASWQYPDITVARILYEGRVFQSPHFIESPWRQSEFFSSIDNKKGQIDVFYTQRRAPSFEGPFLKEERNLIHNIARLIAGYINDYKGREVLHKNIYEANVNNKPGNYRQTLVKQRPPLQQFFNQQSLDKYIYLDMMKYKVKDILFVATLYDAFVLENEDAFFEQFMGEIYQYSLFSLPRITGVSSEEEALEMVQSASFDFVIIMVGNDEDSPVEMSRKIKDRKPELPIFLLLNQQGNTKYFQDLVPVTPSIDKLFVWNGDSQIFFAIVKSVEDKINAENDTHIGLVRIILLIEDSATYYSRYLTILYSIVFGHIQQLIASERNELEKISKMRSRPKILHAANFEEAVYLFNKYKEFMLCVISDVEYEKNGIINKTAGLSFIKFAKKQITNLPAILQSSDAKYLQKAHELGAAFINKNSDNLQVDLKRILVHYLGFGDFIFRDKNNRKIAVAHNLREFEILLETIPDESLILHAQKNQFSFWLIARGEIYLAKVVNPVKVTEFTKPEEVRSFLINAINKCRDDKKRAKILSFEETYNFRDKNVVALASGSLGGKGRGLAFINSLIHNIDFSPLTNEINICTPITAIIGTDEYEQFLQINKLYKIVNGESDYSRIRDCFMKGSLSFSLIRKLRVYCDQVRKPIAVRSSSLFEDSLTNPFAGVFDTYIIPNNQPVDRLRLESLMTAIKLVYASIYSTHARSYFKAVNYNVEVEKMAVVLQELVGNQYGDYYYPHISGVAQSFNYYPVSHMNPGDGFALIAMGLGTYVMEGGKSFRFSPRYPQAEPASIKNQLNNTQVEFLAVDMNRNDTNYLKYGEKASLVSLPIAEAEKHRTLKHCASVYNANNDTILPGLLSNGPRILNFANILKHNYIPLAPTIDLLLNNVKEAMGTPVEIEFAVDLNKDEKGLASFYLLQIKPLVGNQLTTEMNVSSLDHTHAILYTQTSMGNGKLDDIQDVIFVDIEMFDPLKTREMAGEVEYLNNIMRNSGRKYILLGMGRWGTQDPSVGIPVNWAQISNARIIVEVGLPNYTLDSSLGSHFFHNITSMNIGYFSIQTTHKDEYIRWDRFRSQRLITKTNYFRHVRFPKPLTVMMDGKNRIAIIIENNKL
jgi:hypothetical protein